MVAVFWLGILIEATQETGVVPPRRRAVIGTPIYLPHTTRRETVGVFYSPPTGEEIVIPIGMNRIIISLKKIISKLTNKNF